MQLKLRTKFVIPIIVLFLIGMSLSSYITFTTSINELESTIYKQFDQTAKTINTNLDVWVTRNKLDMKRWSRQDIFIDAIPENFLGKAARKAALPLIKGIQNEYKFYESIFLCDVKGKVLVSSSMTMEGETLLDKELVKDASKDSLFVSRVIQSPDTGEPVFIISAPVGLNKKVSGKLIGVINFAYFTSSSVDNVRFGKNGYVYILDKKQRIVAHPDKHLLFKSGFALESKNLMGKYNEDIINVVKKNLTLELQIGITAPVEEILAPAKKIRHRIILVTIMVSIIVVTMVTLFITRFVTTPINQFVQSMKKVAKGDLDKNIRIDTTDEFSKMAQSFNEMANALKENKAELEQTYDRLIQKERMAAIGELTARIAHEIKNPLGIIKGSAQILTDESESSEIKNEVAQFIIEEVNHLSIRVKELLGHAKPMALQLEKIDLNQVLNERVKFWETQQPSFKKVTIITDFDKNLPSIDMDKRLIKQLVMNMIINACEAMPDTGTLKIITKKYSNDTQNKEKRPGADGCLLIFEDTGCGIEKKDIAQVFDPFFTTKEGGTGLGLSAVYRIVEKHDATIQIKSKIDTGTSFIMKFPFINPMKQTCENGETNA